MHIGTLIRAERAEQGITLRGLEDKCGVPHQAIWKVEKGARDPQFKLLLSILAGLGVTLSIHPDKLEWRGATGTVVLPIIDAVPEFSISG